MARCEMVSRKDDATEMLLDGDEVTAVVAATGLQTRTVSHIQARLDLPILGDNTFSGMGISRCKLCGRPLSTHLVARLCEAAAE